ncbi:hypothetical protein T751_00110 [Klebsiella phage T751]|nr:hypothetical protein K751_00049 [Klebsiella phage K751]URG13673.1 hypothetical protein T751_00110 [Klebsiella phage T751]URG17993.1 hypothetical protein T765_00154 [Klebsiella phage T765]
MFDKATRLKLRFSSAKGDLSVEQVWDLGLTSLNEMAKGLSRELKAATIDDEDFIGNNTSVDTQLLQLRFDIVKSIINTKLKERDDSLSAAEKREHNQAILELIKKKQQEELAGKSVEELQALLK